MAERNPDTKPSYLPPIGSIRHIISRTRVEIHEQRELCRVKTRNGKYGGYRKNILTENLKERYDTFLICGICKGIMREPCFTSSGEQFCSCCEVQSDLSKQTPNEIIRKMVNLLKCSCPLLGRGCKWLGTLEYCEEHLDTCGYVRDECKLDCGSVQQRNDLRSHEEYNCLNRKVKCEHCYVNCTFCDMSEHHKVCPKLKVSCELKCGVVMCREDMAQHMEHECVEKVVMCPFAKYNCEVSIKWKYLSKHLEEKRIEHLELKLNAVEDEVRTYREEDMEEVNQQRKHMDKQIIGINRMSEQMSALSSISDTTKLDWNIENISKFIQINHIPEQRNMAGSNLNIHFLKEHIYVSYADTQEYRFSAKFLIRLYSTIRCKVVKQYDCGNVYVYGMSHSGEYEKSRIARILKSDAEELSRTGSANKLILEMYITKL